MSKNRKRGLLILGIGIMVVMVSLFLPAKNKILNTENQIERNTYGGGERDVSLLVVSSLGENSVDYSIGERKYTQAEAQEMLSDFISLIEVQVLGENVSPDNISSDLNYVDEVEGYPFEVSWSCDHSDLIGTEGNIREEIKENTPVMLAANIEYEELEYEHIFPVVLVPREYTSQEQWLNDIEDAVYLADKESSNDPFVTLPQQVNGKEISWKEKRSNKGLQIGVFCMVIAMIFFFSDSVEARENQKKRAEEIRKEYPEFVLKCSMLIGAGMTIRQAFERLARSYQQGLVKKKALYEELIIGVRELGNGVPERLVYENFGKRCGIRETEKFGHIMSRNLKKGSDGLKKALREEAQEAMEMQKESVKKQGETAGTKLLFPMLILLLIVMVIIMIPAFSTFNI